MRPTRKAGLIAAALALVGMLAAAAVAYASVIRPGNLARRITLPDVAPAPQTCPCEGPAIGGSWPSHGAYVSCVAQLTRNRLKSRQISGHDAILVLRQAARSACGVRGHAPANTSVCGAQISLDCATVRTAHADDCTECDAALTGELVVCARSRDAAGDESTSCGLPPRPAPGSKIVDLRSGVDCASCEAKLGTSATEGVTCLEASCAEE